MSVAQVLHPFPFEHPAREANHINGGIQYRFMFDNGYGASVVQHDFSYGGSEGLWELAVLEAPSWRITYSTHIASDVMGWLTALDVADTLDAICRLGDMSSAWPPPSTPRMFGPNGNVRL
jgi:hypothetical protein